MFSWQVWDLNYPYSTGAKFCFWYFVPILKFTKIWFPTGSEWCEGTPRTHCTIPWEMRSEKSILWCWLPSLLLLWSAELSYQMTPQQTVSSSLLPSETQIIDQSCCYSVENDQPMCFSIRFEAATIQHSQGENTDFILRPQFPCLQKQVSLHFQSFVKTHLGHTIPFHEKRDRGRLFC